CNLLHLFSIPGSISFKQSNLARSAITDIVVTLLAYTESLFPGGGHMDKIGEFATQLFLELQPALDWAVGNWAVTSIVLVMLIYWAGKQKRLDRHQL
ncbi:MAG: hypothetical protein ACREP3_08785, partial [Candidatus Binatia bacterium]